MSLDIGFDFRSSLGAATDPANCFFLNTTDLYPDVIGCITCGWEDGISGLDESTGVAVLNGAHYGQSSQRFRVDLSNTMTANITLAAGYSGSSEPQAIGLFDTTTSLWTVSGTTGASQYLDANGVLRTSAANWAANQTTKSATFATTILRLKIGTGGAAYTTLNHLRITEVVGGGGAALLTRPKVIRQAVKRAAYY